MQDIRILIVEDQPIYRDGLRAVIADDPALTVCGEAENGRDALHFLEDREVDIVLLDINMPVLGGLDTVPILQQQYPKLGIIMLTIYDDPGMIMQFFRLEVAGFLLKEANGKEIRDAIKTVAQGGTYYGIEVMKAISRQLRHQLQEPPEAKPKLTPRESEILQLIVQEYTAPEIAEKLFISTETVDTHRKNIREKFMVKNTAGIVREALRWQLVDIS